MAAAGVRKATGIGLMVLPAVLFAFAYRWLDGFALYSEEEVLDASVLHPLFNSAEHFADEFWRPGMAQRERLAGITAAYKGTVQALAAVGISAFLESSSLIGLLRHGGHMPWEVDGDVGIVAEECRSSNATKAMLQEVAGPDMAVLKFACSCEEHCEGDSKRMAGRMAHRGTGAVVDIFMYGPVSEKRPWQKLAAHDGTDWWERVDDHADYTFPRDALLPLQAGMFEGVNISLPRDPRAFLSWEYGKCLGVHAWPWGVLLYAPASVLVPAAVIAKGAMFLSALQPAGAKRTSPWLAVASGTYAAVALGAFQGGVTLVLLLLAWLCEFLAVLVWPDLLGAGCGESTPPARRSRRRYRLAGLLAMAVLLLELRGVLGQVLCQIDDFYLHPLRPKSWTLCLFGQCWDF